MENMLKLAMLKYVNEKLRGFKILLEKTQGRRGQKWRKYNLLPEWEIVQKPESIF